MLFSPFIIAAMYWRVLKNPVGQARKRQALDPHGAGAFQGGEEYAFAVIITIIVKDSSVVVGIFVLF